MGHLGGSQVATHKLDTIMDHVLVWRETIQIRG